MILDRNEAKDSAEREREKIETRKWKLLFRQPSLPLITNPINRRSRISISYTVSPACSDASIPDSFDHWRKGQADCSLAGNRIPVASSISGCAAEPSFPPRVSRRIRLGGLVSRGGWGTWRVIEGVRARFNPSPAANFHGLWARKSTRGRNYRTNLM